MKKLMTCVGSISLLCLVNQSFAADQTFDFKLQANDFSPVDPSGGSLPDYKNLQSVTVPVGQFELECSVTNAATIGEAQTCQTVNILLNTNKFRRVPLSSACQGMGPQLSAMNFVDNGQPGASPITVNLEERAFAINGAPDNPLPFDMQCVLKAL